LVTIISSPGCQPCRISKMHMDRKGIEYTERNVADDPEALELAKSLGYNSSPVIIAGDRHWSGLRLDLIDSLAA
jgi:glutaredoxin-like protein NrdH